MINLNNLCTFEGRLTKDVQVSMVGQGQNAYKKVLFTLAVDRVLTKEQKQAKANGAEMTTADFPQFVATGTNAELIENYFVKGKPMKVVASFQSYKKNDGNNGQSFGYIFKVENVGFVSTDNSSNAGAGNNNRNGNSNGNGYNNNGNNGYNNNRNNYNNNNNNNYNNNYNNGYNSNNDFFPVDEGDSPF